MKSTTKTYLPRDPIAHRGWILVDANGKILGRLATEIANVLRGKNKPTYTPHMDTGDFVVVVNAEKVKLTGRKEQNKTYVRYSGYRSGLKSQTAAQLRERHPDRMIRLAVRGMLPKNTLSRNLLTHLKIYAGDKHPHAAQAPVATELV